jgi:hypothetical protein
MAPLSKRGLGLFVIRIGPGDIRALHFHQDLALGHGIAQPGENFDHPAGCQRDHRNGPRYVGAHHAGHVQLGRRVDLARGHQRKFAGVVHLEQTRRLDPLDLGRRWRFRFGVAFALRAAAGQCQGQGQSQAHSRNRQFTPFHWITSRPTARFN